ncbi:MAG: sugar O-acetyltransferase [Burkholderiales bacterium]
MPGEKSKMLAGALYDARDPELSAERGRARALCAAFNTATADDDAGRAATLATLLNAPTDASIQPPFFCDYGYNIRLGTNAYFNVNCVVLDVMPVTIGANALFGPGVHIYTATHPASAAERRSGLELGRAVMIGDDVWVGGGSVICPGVHIGDGSVIGAGSVVTRDVPPGVVAAGNPCRVIRAATSPGTAPSASPTPR